MLFLEQCLDKTKSFLWGRLPRFCTQNRMLSAFALRKKHPPSIIVPVRPAFDGEAARRLLCSQASPSLGFLAACAARSESWLRLVDAGDVVDAQSSSHAVLAKRSSDEMMASDAVPGTGTEPGVLTKVPRLDEKSTQRGSSAPMCMDQPRDGVGVDHAVLAMQKWLGCVCVV